jgi:hypothetical protein
MDPMSSGKWARAALALVRRHGLTGFTAGSAGGRAPLAPTPSKPSDPPHAKRRRPRDPAATPRLPMRKTTLRIGGNEGSATPYYRHASKVSEGPHAQRWEQVARFGGAGRWWAHRLGMPGNRRPDATAGGALAISYSRCQKSPDEGTRRGGAGTSRWHARLMVGVLANIIRTSVRKSSRILIVGSLRNHGKDCPLDFGNREDPHSCRCCCGDC